jgi:hypothetical protein
MIIFFWIQAQNMKNKIVILKNLFDTTPRTFYEED